MALTNNVGYLLQHVATSLARQIDEQLQTRLGIGYSQYKIMMALQDSPGIRQRQIAELLGQTEASISRQIKLMQGDGLLMSRLRPEDKRERITSLTNKGERLAEAAAAVLNDYYTPIVRSMGVGQQLQFAEALAVMHQHICRGDRAGRCRHLY